MNVSRGTILAEDYFDLKDLWFSSLFQGEDFIWACLAPKIKANWIRSNIKPNISSLKRAESGLVLEDAEIQCPGGVAQVRAGAICVGSDIELRAGVILESTAWVSGPTILGEGTVIRHGAYVRGEVLTGKSVVIGHATEVKSSLLLNGAKAAHFAYVGDSILGNDVNLGAGTKLSNLKMNHTEVSVRAGAQKIKTGLKKIGAILGDGVETGCNSVLNPGVIMGPKSIVYPCVSVRNGIYPSGHVVKI